jgi:uncharacterized protein (TIGR00661 family)
MTIDNSTKNILVAPLNWGLGHATRCIPIINELLKNGFNPIIASDGIALSLLKKEFPELLALELPSYNIEYSKKASGFKWKLLKNSPKMINAILNENQLVKNWVTLYNLKGIISDNRLGVRSKKAPSVFITHQLTVLSGKTTWISSKLHHYFIRKFDECWVPDSKNFMNLSGKLGHLKKTNLKIKYIGILSRLQKKELPIQYQLMVILSGPEPQRTLLEELLIEKLEKYTEKVIFIKGKVEAEQKQEVKANITFYNYMQTEQLEKTFNESEMVLCRSGYSTIMDLAKLEKKAFFIPTPGQLEQEYLSKKYKREGLVPSSKQDKFKLEDLIFVSLYSGLPKTTSTIDWNLLFLLFEGE